ncbi:MAG TPA: hypothetical protein PKV98_04495 [Burkholderiaceae bacterium]|nr:hypothetical protein [Burkholderiaceae bacterium]
MSAAKQFLGWCMQAKFAIAAAAVRASEQVAERRKTMTKEELAKAYAEAQVAMAFEARLRNLYGRNWDKGAIERKPHEGKREVARRQRQIARGLISPVHAASTYPVPA